MTELTLVHLYPRQLGLNGEIGNVTALVRRAEWRGVTVRVVDVEPGGDLPGEAHLVHIGSGPRSLQAELHDDVDRIASTLRAWAADGVPVLAIAAGWQLLGRELVDTDGSRRAGAGVFPSRARLIGSRAVGEVVGTSALGEVAGFENHGAATRLDDGAEPLARLHAGRGNAADEPARPGSAEGVLAGASVGTNLHGPFLPMNPAWADRLLDAAAERAGALLAPPDERIHLVDERAAKSRAAVRARLRV